MRCLASIALVFVGTGCQQARLSYSVFNNTGAPFAVQTCESRYIVRAGQALAVEPDGICAQWAILATQRVWRYTAIPVGPQGMSRDDYLRPVGRGHWQLALQVQPGGEILALEVGAGPPVPADHPQPDGFPLRPAATEL